MDIIKHRRFIQANGGYLTVRCTCNQGNLGPRTKIVLYTRKFNLEEKTKLFDQFEMTEYLGTPLGPLLQANSKINVRHWFSFLDAEGQWILQVDSEKVAFRSQLGRDGVCAQSEGDSSSTRLLLMTAD